jgi:hypothetical protein
MTFSSAAGTVMVAGISQILPEGTLAAFPLPPESWRLDLVLRNLRVKTNAALVWPAVVVELDAIRLKCHYLPVVERRESRKDRHMSGVVILLIMSWLGHSFSRRIRFATFRNMLTAVSRGSISCDMPAPSPCSTTKTDGEQPSYCPGSLRTCSRYLLT